MPQTTRRAEKMALAKQRRKVRVGLAAKKKARYESRKGTVTKARKSHPHRSSTSKQKRLG